MSLEIQPEDVYATSSGEAVVKLLQSNLKLVCAFNAPLFDDFFWLEKARSRFFMIGFDQARSCCSFGEVWT